MRIDLILRSTNEIITFNHQHLLTGTIHKWLGWNAEHGKMSLYSFSQIEGGKATADGLRFENGSGFFYSSYNTELIKRIISGIRNDPSMFDGLVVSEVIMREDPDLSDRELFFVGSPIFIKRTAGNKINHILYDDPYARECMIETLQSKMKEVGLIDDSLDIRFEQTYPNAKTKKITYKGIQNRANWCPVIIQGKPETKLFAWNVGIGNSTGIGFGAIR